VGTEASDVPQADKPGTGLRQREDGWAGMANWPALRRRPDPPLWMRMELASLRIAFPAFSFAVCNGWRGPAFEAWRDPALGGLYAVITSDAGELRSALEAAQAGV
jgi:hypothetical protein